jgi:hypothetical protein
LNPLFEWFYKYAAPTVLTEIRKAREVEKKEKRRKLFPIRLTDFETLRDWTCFDAEWIWHGSARVFHSGLFQLESPGGRPALADSHLATFESAFARLKKDLEAENSRK